MQIRKHRHRWSYAWPGGLVQLVWCMTRGCHYSYEQGLLFDPEAYRAGT